MRARYSAESTPQAKGIRIGRQRPPLSGACLGLGGRGPQAPLPRGLSGSAGTKRVPFADTGDCRFALSKNLESARLNLNMSNAIELPGPPTGYRHARCYASVDANCSSKISREHFISKSLLRRIELNNTAKVAGMTWQKPESFDIIAVKGMASKVLCKRHNEALSNLDSVITSLAETIHGFDKTTTSVDQNASFNGSDVERWMLKCLFGLSASGNITSTMKPECLDLLFARRHWPEHWGLYFSMMPGPVYHTDSLLIETRVDPSRNLILAANFYIQGLPLVLVLGKPADPRTFGIWRPEKLLFKFPKSEKTLHLTWDEGRSGAPVILTRSGTYDGSPPSWKDWEKNG
jgi:hypothetical protein